MNEKTLKKELTKARISETDFLIRRKKQKQSYIDSKIEKYVPDGLAGTLEAAFTKAFEIIFRDGTGIIKKTYGRGSSDNDDIVMLRNRARAILAKDTVVTAAEGTGLGLAGIGLPDIPVFTAVLLRNIYQLAECYGFDYESKTEQVFILKLIETGLSYGESAEKLNDELNALMEQIDNEDYTYYGLISQQIKAASEAVSKEVLYMKFIQTIPVVGAAGGISNLTCLNKVGRFAELKYRKRFIMKTINTQQEK
ncbi:MAG: EcsC family protein [Clostridiales bacterium]|nr:EcsC family protein [Clostridiales bacterium]